MLFGKTKENGAWLAKASDFRVMLGGGGRLIYVAAFRLRARLMKIGA